MFYKPIFILLVFLFIHPIELNTKNDERRTMKEKRLEDKSCYYSNHYLDTFESDKLFNSTTKTHFTRIEKPNYMEVSFQIQNLITWQLDYQVLGIAIDEKRKIGYICNGDSWNKNFLVVDLNEMDYSNSPKVISKAKLYGTKITHSELVLTEDHLLFVDTMNKLRVVDVSDPHQPVVIRPLDELGELDSASFDVFENYFFLINHGSDHSRRKLDIYDITNRTNPSLIVSWSLNGSFEDNENIKDLSVTKDVIAITSSYRIVIFDIANITSPLKIIQKTVDDPKWIDKVQIDRKRNLLYIAGRSLFKVGRLNDIKNFDFSSSYENFDATAKKPVFDGNRVFMYHNSYASFSSGIEILDYSDILNPIFIDSLYFKGVDNLFLDYFNEMLFITQDYPGELDKHIEIHDLHSKVILNTTCGSGEDIISLTACNIENECASTQFKFSMVCEHLICKNGGTGNEDCSKCVCTKNFAGAECQIDVSLVFVVLILIVSILGIFIVLGVVVVLTIIVFKKNKILNQKVMDLVSFITRKNYVEIKEVK